MQDRIDGAIDLKRQRDIVNQKFEIGIEQQMRNVGTATGAKVVDREDLPAVGQKRSQRLEATKPAPPVITTFFDIQRPPSPLRRQSSRNPSARRSTASAQHCAFRFDLLTDIAQKLACTRYRAGFLSCGHILIWELHRQW